MIALGKGGKTMRRGIQVILVQQVDRGLIKLANHLIERNADDDWGIIEFDNKAEVVRLLSGRKVVVDEIAYVNTEGI